MQPSNDFLSITRDFSSQDQDRWRRASERLIALARTNHLSAEEIAQLAIAVSESGRLFKLSPLEGPYVDVPSTGGPGSLSTLLCPLLLASAGFRVPKVSATGSVAGAIDTMALLPSYRFRLSQHEFMGCLSRSRFAHTMQAADFCPVDKVMIEARRKHNAMAIPALATASLLGKKLAVSGTAVLFDFRVGPTGNVGATFEEARSVANLFRQVASLLSLQVGIGLSDNRSFPSSAMGRLESLDLLYRLITVPGDACRLDRLHLVDCIHLSAGAAVLCNAGILEDWHTKFWEFLRKGTVEECLINHLEQQGSSRAELEEVIGSRNRQKVIEMTASKSGFWVPPDIFTVKTWLKSKVWSIDIEDISRSPERQVGIRIIAEPFSKVVKGQAVLEVRLPPESDVRVPSAISGSIVLEPQQPPRRVLHLLA